MATIEQRVSALERHATRGADAMAGFSQVHAQYRELAEHHGIADRAMGGSQPMPGESLDHYTGRLFTAFKGYSPQWKDCDLEKAGPAVRIAAQDIRRDALAARIATAPGELRRIVKNVGGREHITWAGSDDACWRQFTNESFMVGSFRKSSARELAVAQPDFAPRTGGR